MTRLPEFIKTGERLNNHHIFQKRFLLFFCLLFGGNSFLNAQALTGIATRWADSFSEWDIFTDDEDITGEITMRWPQKPDWTQWQFRLDEVSGSIRQRFKNDPSEWNITCNGENITARMVYRGDARQWRISNNELTFTLVTKWGNKLDEWLVREENYGFYDLYTVVEGDPREWVLADQMDEEVSSGMKIAIAFVTIINSTPKF